MPEKPEGTDVFIQFAVNGGIVPDPELARKMAALLVEHTHGADELLRQLPLEVADEGDTWRVTGSASPDNKAFSEIVVRLNKRDGRVINFTHMVRPDLHHPPT